MNGPSNKKEQREESTDRFGSPSQTRNLISIYDLNPKHYMGVRQADSHNEQSEIRLPTFQKSQIREAFLKLRSHPGDSVTIPHRTDSYLKDAVLHILIPTVQTKLIQ